MTISQLVSLTEDEVAMCLYIVNVIAPPKSPVMEFRREHLMGFKTDMLVKRILDAFPMIKPESHAIYSSLLEKLGMKIEIKYEQPPMPVSPQTGSAERSAEIPTPTPEVVSTTIDTLQTGSAEISGVSII